MIRIHAAAYVTDMWRFEPVMRAELGESRTDEAVRGKMGQNGGYGPGGKM